MFVTIERDTEEPPNVRGMFMMSHGVFDVAPEVFVSKWRIDLGQSDDFVRVRALQEYGAALRLRVSHPDLGRGGRGLLNQEAAKAGFAAIDRQVQECARLVADDLRPHGRPEILAKCRTASEATRSYRIIASLVEDQVCYHVVYDTDDGLDFGHEHEINLPSYDDAATAIGLIMDRFPPHIDRRAIFDPVAKRGFDNQREDKSREAVAAREKKIQDEINRVARERALARARIQIYDTKVKAKKRTIRVRTLGGANLDLTGFEVGLFLVHPSAGSGMAKSAGYSITHIPTGYLVVSDQPGNSSAKILADFLGRLGNWNFRDIALAKRETLQTAARLTGAFVAQNWVEVIAITPARKGMRWL